MNKNSLKMLQKQICFEHYNTVYYLKTDIKIYPELYSNDNLFDEYLKNVDI